MEKLCQNLLDGDTLQDPRGPLAEDGLEFPLFGLWESAAHTGEGHQTGAVEIGGSVFAQGAEEGGDDDFLALLCGQWEEGSEGPPTDAAASQERLTAALLHLSPSTSAQRKQRVPVQLPPPGPTVAVVP